MTRSRMIASVVTLALVTPAAWMLAVRGASGATPAHTYYLAPAGSDTTGAGTASAPWKSFGRAFQTVRAGDLLLAMDGTYNDSLAPPATLNGTATAPIMVRAQHDGQAFINGGATRVPIRLAGNDWFEIEGFVAYNSSQGVVMIEKQNDANRAQHNTFRRVSAYNSASTCGGDPNASACNHHTWELYGTDHTLIEDCVGAGRGRSVGTSISTTFTTLRRCWFRGDKGTGWHNDAIGDHGGFTAYNSTNATFENNVWADPNPNAHPSAAGSTIGTTCTAARRARST